MGYLTHLKTALVLALQNTFNSTYPEADFRNLLVSIEYPVRKTSYPSIWVDYEDSDKLTIAGIRHQEVIDIDPDHIRHVTRWRFKGYAQFTIVALTSLERDRLYDEMVRILAFGSGGLDDPGVNIFRQYIEDNPLIAMNMDFDEIESSGNNASPGTPWGTDEIIYERTINMELLGEFVSDGVTYELVPLSKVRILPQVMSPDGTYVDQYPAAPGHPDSSAYDPFAWQ
jgi:hypothetical protein